MKLLEREFPGGPVVRTWSFHIQVQSLVRELRFRKLPHMVPKKKEEKSYLEIKLTFRNCSIEKNIFLKIC